MMTKEQRIFTYLITLGHLFVMTGLNVLCYCFWGWDGVQEAWGFYAISLGYIGFLIFYSIKTKTKSVLPECLAIDAVVWLLQLFMMSRGWLNPPTLCTGMGEGYGIGFTYTPLIYIIIEVSIVITLLVVFGIMYILDFTKKGFGR